MRSDNMSKESSPEERLLRLIKGKKGSDAGDRNNEGRSQDNAEADNNIVPVPVPFGTGEAKSGHTPAVPAIKPARHKTRPAAFTARPRIIIRPIYMAAGLVLVSIPVVLYVIFNLMEPKDEQELENLKRLIASISTAGQHEASQASDNGPVKNVKPPIQDKPEASLNDYQKMINAKPIFTAPVTGMGKAAVQEDPGLIDISKDLRLVGTIPGDIPQAIIEDKKNNQTLFLKEGEMINNIKVKSISTGRVVLVYNEETITLSL
jgi:hypothetical protein